MVDEQDRLLPIANVCRVMKQILPPTAKISKEAKETMQECATEFISFVTGEASDKCHKENRKTVNGDDICWALSSLGFDNYAEAIVRYLHKFREAEREKVINNQSKAAAAAATHQDKDFGDFNCKGCQKEKQQKTETSNPLEFRVLEKGNSSSSFTKPS
ncbi:nuclear transcription factor Y subunit B-4 [Ricinus communis]|uniref:Ccaat-binding transcription factor subunit A, putative n=1 Tax=Ricinus communis TaxID=3988 RepID=B9RF86_RICCO|nr:nuclear transcription factor Y subunit B-4 [Ricinus communis]EEF49857.1 ccaat-binding transcription factor subunit A, putative [Ricinus communis]|eukprot:XP_002512405.1 nuclear transcription factor Y subunit B-4 [Ricinus communis]